MNNNKQQPADQLRAGAQACLEAIRTMEVIANSNDGQDYVQQREQMRSTLLNAAEPLSPYMTGFITALAEYIDLNLGCNNRLSQHWIPEATLSQDEVEAIRRQCYAVVSA
jgi:hypothetical protein